MALQMSHMKQFALLHQLVGFSFCLSVLRGLVFCFKFEQSLQSTVQQNQSSFDVLQQDVMSLKQLVARTRPGLTRLHPDIQRLEHDIDELITGWENFTIQLNDR